MLQSKALVIFLDYARQLKNGAHIASGNHSTIQTEIKELTSCRVNVDSQRQDLLEIAKFSNGDDKQRPVMTQLSLEVGNFFLISGSVSSPSRGSSMYSEIRL